MTENRTGFGPSTPGYAAVALCVALAACGGDSGNEARAEDTSSADSARQTRLINVEVETVEPQAFTDVVQVTGDVQAQRDVTVSAEESGNIRALYAEKGNVVRAGQPIAKIEDRVLRAQAEQAESQAELAQETWQRQRQLWEEDSIGSEMMYLEARYAARTASANAQALARRLERTIVRAPFSGMLEEVPVEIGTMVSPGAPVARVVDIDTVEVTAGVPERYAGDIGRGAAALVELGVLGSREFSGVISFVGSALNERNRTVPIEIRVPNPGRLIKPGMVAQIGIARREYEEALTVPQDAVLRSEDGYYVFVAVERDGRTIAEARPVRTGASRSGRVLIESGLETGDRVVVVGQNQAAEGDALRLANRGQAED